MNKETLRMQMLAGIITEGQYNEATKPTVIYKNGTEDMSWNKEILVNGESYLSGQTNQEKQQEIANFLGVKDKNGFKIEIGQMYEPDIFAEVLGYASVKDLAIAIAEKYGVELTVDLNELYQKGDNIFNIIDLEIITPDQDSNYDNNDTEDEDETNYGIGFPTQKVGKDYTDDQKQNFINYLKNKAEEGNKKAIKLYKIAQTNPESKEFF